MLINAYYFLLNDIFKGNPSITFKVGSTGIISPMAERCKRNRPNTCAPVGTMALVEPRRSAGWWPFIPPKTKHSCKMAT